MVIIIGYEEVSDQESTGSAWGWTITWTCDLGTVRGNRSRADVRSGLVTVLHHIAQGSRSAEGRDFLQCERHQQTRLRYRLGAM